jgi:hypothetical protein
MPRFATGVLSGIAGLAGLWVLSQSTPARAYPPGVGITGKETNCMGCHVNNGPWTDEAKTIIDVLDKELGRSLRQPDGSLLRLSGDRPEPC